ncbi:hypothetical protein QAD02_009412, partial [Eretmocerus hayati]
YNTNLPVSLEVVSLRQITVTEGKRNTLSERNINMVLDIAKFGLNDSHVIFILLTPPSHGSLQLDKQPLPPKMPFTLQDVYQHKLSYLHDGSETSTDSMILKISLHAPAGSRLPLPGYFQDSLRFTLPVSVTPANDPPRLEIPSNAILRLAQGTQKTLTRDLVWASDPDTSVDSLIFTLLNNDSDVGHVERISGGSPSAYLSAQTVVTFSLAELARGSIDYVHNGKNKTEAVLGLRVSDGEATSSPQYLHISTYPLSIRPRHNTGLVVVHRSFSYLNPANLSFTTNADDSRVAIRYIIVKLPQYGVLQRQRESNQVWTNTDHFTSYDLERQSIRYYHNAGSPRQDNFKFQVGVRELYSPTIYDFNVTFIILELREVQRDNVNFSDSAEVIVNSQRIQYQTNPLPTEATMIIYSLMAIPKYGHMYLDKEELRIGQTFSQHDVDSNRLRYRHFRRAYSSIEDQVSFKITAPQCPDITTSMKFYYQPTALTDLPRKIETIDVIEGHRAFLKISRASYSNFGVNSLNFNLTKIPQHGCLSLYNNSIPIRPNTTYFSSDELDSHSVFYVHDDSESNHDSLEFLAISDDTDFMYIGMLNIEIELQNDNPPERVDRRIFHVVSKSDRLITNTDLQFTDRDSGTKTSDLVYTIKQLSNGMIYRINEPMYQINRFTQKDIDEGKIVYKHRGSKLERIDFTVSDGELSVNDDLEIMAGQAYAKLILRQDTVVQANRTVSLDPKNIDVDTNVFANLSDITFAVVEPPSYGLILKYGKETSIFDKEDLYQKIVVYRHVGQLKEDQLKLRVNVKGTEDIGTFKIKVFPESYWEPLIVQNNNTVYVEEATSVILNRKSLEVKHPNIPPIRIAYYIKEWPKNGYLELQMHNDDSPYDEESDDDFSTNLIKGFEQSQINDGRVHYVQSTPNRTQDCFVVDVTNGITWLHNLTVNIVIVPDKLYMEARKLSVQEGVSVLLHESDFYAVTAYYAGKITDYRLVEKPKHGSLIDSTRKSPTKKFSFRQLSLREIAYKHNGDESLIDSFKMVAIAGEKSSEPFVVWIDVVPINDEVPVVVNKTRFIMWQGGLSYITKDILAAVDNDTFPTELVFNILDTQNGYFSLVEAPGIEIRNFSQEMINTGKILFTHTNGSDATFKFMVNDGLHSSETHSLNISTKPVRILIEHNRPLKLFPLARKPIGHELLLAKCTDTERDVKYFVRSVPSMGKIIMESSEGIWLEVDRFTQNDLNNSRVMYEHNKQFNNLTASDGFIFDIETRFAAPIKNQVFKVDISVSSGGLHRYVNVTPLLVDEGGSASLNMNISGIVGFLRTKVAIHNPEVTIRLNKQPDHGHVMLLPDLNLTIYSQSEVESGKITYFHDHSDTLKDQIDVSVYFSPGHVFLCNVSVPVEITPINDQPFKLDVVKPIDVVQNQTQTITRNNLLTTDPDTEPKDIIYEIINKPTHGRLLLLSADQNTNGDIHEAQKFTQLDVDSSRLVYEHKGPLLLSTFYFRVSDGRFNPAYKIFDIKVHPIKLNVTVVKPVEIQQGMTTTTIDNDCIKLDTNVRQDLVSYEVVVPPRYGSLHAREQQSNFRHSDLTAKSVMYVQQDMTASNDSLELVARASDFELHGIHVPIRVVPLMIMNNNLDVFVGEKTKLSIHYFDATPLAKLAGGNPGYKIIRKPKFARILKIVNKTMSSGEKRGIHEEEVSKFSHQHILSGLIYLTCKEVPTDDVRGILDSFDFVLAMPKIVTQYQPATSTFDFRIKLVSDYYNNSINGPMDPVGHEGELAIAPNMSDDYTPLLGMLMGVLFLGICVIVTIRCKQTEYKDEEDEDESEEYHDKVEPATPSVMTLPRPPDHLLPATPHMKRYTNDHHNNHSLGSSTPLPPPIMPSLTSTLPQCKVIPLNPMNSMTGSEIDVSARYPYGVSEADEWSSFETSACPSQTSQRTTSNPLLRRNQYWV